MAGYTIRREVFQTVHIEADSLPLARQYAEENQHFMTWEIEESTITEIVPDEWDCDRDGHVRIGQPECLYCGQMDQD